MTVSVNKKWLMPLIAMSVLLIMIAAMAGLFDHKIAPQALSPKEAFSGNTYTVAHQLVAEQEAVPATIIAQQNTLISSRILAPIKALKVRAGQVVRQGDVLITLDDSELQTQVAQAKAQLAAVHTQLTQAQLQLTRAIKLQEQGLIAVNDLDEARANFDELSASKARAEQGLAQSKVMLSYSQIESPINGKVVDRMAEPGDVVSPGQVLLSIYNPTSMQVEASVREQKAVQLVIGQRLDIEVASIGLVTTATIAEIVPVADSSARSFLVKLDISQDTRLMPGMFTKLKLPAEGSEQLVIPSSLVIPYGQLEMVQVVTNGGVERRYIRTGKSIDNQNVVVISGLEAGELIALQ